MSNIPASAAIDRRTDKETVLQPSRAPSYVVRAGQNPIDGLLLALIVFNVGCMLYYLFGAYQLQFHSDSAVANLLAQEIYETGEFFPRDWNYVNKDVWVVFMHAWIVPMLPFFKNGFALHAAASAVGCILTGIATWGICAMAGMSTRAKLVALALFSGGFTHSMSEHLYGQQAYGTIYFIACAILYCGWNYLYGGNGRRWRWGLALAFLVATAAAANPQRALIYDLLPLFAAVVAVYINREHVFKHSPASTAPALQLGAVTGVAFVLGTMAYRHTLAHNLSPAGGIAVNWVDFRGMVDNAIAIAGGAIGILSGLPTKGAKMASATGAVEALRLIGGAATVVLIPWALRRCLCMRHAGRMFLAAAAAASLGASLFVSVTTTLIDAAVNAPESTARYFVPGLMWALLALVAALFHASDAGRVRRWSAGIAVAILALSAPFAFDVLNARAYHRAGGIGNVNPAQRLARFLESQDLRYGYATYWHAGQVTVLSEGAVKIRQVNFNDGLPEPMRALSSNRWYEPEAWRGPSFLMVAPGEAPTLDLAKLFAAVGAPLRQIDFENYRIYIFGHNIAADFPSWSMRLATPRQFRVTEHTPHKVGRFDPAEQALVAARGEAGVLHFGPYLRLSPGRYLVTFDLRVEGERGKDFGVADVTADEGRATLAARAIVTPGAQRLVLPLTLDEVGNGLEFRVSSTGAGKITLSNVELANAKRP